MPSPEKPRTSVRGVVTALPDLLARLAELVPGRVRVDAKAHGARHYYAHDGALNRWDHVYVAAPHHDGFGPRGDRDLRAALEQECDSRGWRWWAYRASDHYGACIYVDGNEGPDHKGNTPAEALAGAVLAALRGEG